MHARRWSSINESWSRWCFTADHHKLQHGWHWIGDGHALPLLRIPEQHCSEEKAPRLQHIRSALGIPSLGFAAVWAWIIDSQDEFGVPWEAGSERALRAGNPICGGHRLAHLYDKGDLEWHCFEKVLPTWSETCPCFKCPCDRLVGGNRWTDFVHGEWKQKCYTTPMWRRPRHPWFEAELLDVRSMATP